MKAKETLKTLNIIYLALFMGQMLFCAVAYYINMDTVRGEESADIFQIVIPFVVISCIGLSYWLYDMRKKQGQTIEGIDAKAAHYRVSNIIRFAIVEAGNMLALVGFLMTGAMSFLAFFALGMAVFLFYRPSQQAFFNDYSLNEVEKSQLNSM